MSLAPYQGRCPTCGINHPQEFTLEQWVPSTTSGGAMANPSELESLKQQLAECQATNGKLREALEFLWNIIDDIDTYSDMAKSDNSLFRTLVERRQALALPNNATALNELIAARTASLTAEVERLKSGVVCGDCDGSGWLENRVDGRHPCTCMTEAEPYQLLIEQNAELTAQRDVAISTIEFAYKVAVEHDDRIPFDWAMYCEMLHAAIANCKEQK